MAVTAGSACAQTLLHKAISPAQRMLYDTNGVLLAVYVFTLRSEGFTAWTKPRAK
jgi:hypothetical protein